MVDVRTTGGALDAPDLDAYLTILIHSWSKTLTALGFSLIPVFFLLDVFMMPDELLSRFAVYRGVTTAIVVGQYFFLRHSRPSRRGYLHGYFFTLFVSLMIALMTTDLGGFDSTYYAGLNLVMIAVNMLLPWDYIHSVVNSVLIIGLYLGLNLVIPQDGPVSMSILVNNLYFLSGTAVITVSINYVKEKLIKQEFFLRADLKAARDALWGEMEIAKHIQTALLPKVHRMAGYEVAATMLPADEVGGDYYDIIETASGETWVSIGDVSGHGVESGLIMMMTQTSIFTTVNRMAGHLPSKVLELVNSVIKKNISRLGADRYMTLSAVRFDDDKMTFSGLHQDILVHRSRTGVAEYVPTTGTWIGIIDDLKGHVTDATVTIAVGDTILLYTDGITEATNEVGEMFGDQRLKQALSRYADLRVEEIIGNIIRDVREFMEIQHDDLTLVAMRRVDT